MMNARQRPFPFTASQWQELEHQALIFKYIVAGMPIPSDLLYPMRRGLDALSISTPTPPRLFPTHPSKKSSFGSLSFYFLLLLLPVSLSLSLSTGLLIFVVYWMF